MLKDSDKKPGRPKAFDRDEAIEQLMMLFWEKGFDNATQADMMEWTGLSSSSLHNAFGNKPAIFALALRRYNDNATSAVAVIAKSESGLAALRAFVAMRRATVENEGCGPGCLIATTMCELGAREASFLEECERHLEILQRAVAAAIRRGLADGTLSPGDTEKRTALLVAANFGSATIERSVGGDAASAMVDGMAALVESWRS